MEEYEINFDHWHLLFKCHENRYDYFVASSPEIACNMARFKYGDTIDILNVCISEYGATMNDFEKKSPQELNDTKTFTSKGKISGADALGWEVNLLAQSIK